jgi:hypothetical protein
LLFNCALEYAIKKVQENQVRLTLNGTQQLLANADDVNLLGYNIDTTKKNLVARPRLVEMYLHSPICLHGIVLNHLSTGITLPLNRITSTWNIEWNPNFILAFW